MTTTTKKITIEEERKAAEDWFAGAARRSWIEDGRIWLDFGGLAMMLSDKQRQELRDWMTK